MFEIIIYISKAVFLWTMCMAHVLLYSALIFFLNKTMHWNWSFLPYSFFQQLDSLQLTGPPKTKDEAEKDRWDNIKTLGIFINDAINLC